MGWVFDEARAAENSRKANAAGPLRVVAGFEPSRVGSYGKGWELLECGHRGKRTMEEWCRRDREAGKRRRCAACGRTIESD